MTFALPQLAVGSHAYGSGMACIMNAISYLNGDTIITDMPPCADPVLSKLAQYVNDPLCPHRVSTYLGEGLGEVREAVLCSNCSHLMWEIGARIIGTGGVATTRQHLQLGLWAAKESALMYTDFSPARDMLRMLDFYAAGVWTQAQLELNIRSVAVAHLTYMLPIRELRDAALRGPEEDGARSIDVARSVALSLGLLLLGSLQQGAVAFPNRLPWDRAGAMHRIIDKFEQITGHSSQRQWTQDDADTVIREANLKVGV